MILKKLDPLRNSVDCVSKCSFEESKLHYEASRMMNKDFRNLMSNKAIKNPKSNQKFRIGEYNT